MKCPNCGMGLFPNADNGERQGDGTLLFSLPCPNCGEIAMLHSLLDGRVVGWTLSAERKYHPLVAALCKCKAVLYAPLVADIVQLSRSFQRATGLKGDEFGVVATDDAEGKAPQCPGVFAFLPNAMFAEIPSLAGERAVLAPLRGSLLYSAVPTIHKEFLPFLEEA